MWYLVLPGGFLETGYNLNHIPLFPIATITTDHKLIVFFYSSEDQKSDTGLKLKSWCLGYNQAFSRVAFLSGGWREKSVSVPAPASRSHPCPLPCGPSFHLQRLHHHIFLTFFSHHYILLYHSQGWSFTFIIFYFFYLIMCFYFSIRVEIQYMVLHF